MESDVLARLKAFSLSVKEENGVELLEPDVSTRVEEGNRSLIGKVVGGKNSKLCGS